MKVIIAGAGLGGLAAAACLLQRGVEVEVVEQAQALGEVGAGIQQSANAVKVLYDLGLRDELERVVVRPKAFEYRRFDTAELMHRIPLGEQHEAAHGAPYFHIHRADLHDILVRKVRSLDADAIVLDAKAERFEESAAAVTLVLAGGRRVSGDVLVGADGIRSAIRSQILGATPVSYTGDVAWRAVRVARTARVVNESTESRGLYRIEDAEAMREAFRQKDLTKSRSQWLYSYDPLSVPLPA